MQRAIHGRRCERGASLRRLPQDLAGNATLTTAEQNGYALFNGKAHCNQCHLSGTAVGTLDSQKVTCRPEPEYPATLNTTQLGNLGLTSTEENEIVAFLQTLTDGFVTSPATFAAPQRKQ